MAHAPTHMTAGGRRQDHSGGAARYSLSSHLQLFSMWVVSGGVVVVGRGSMVVDRSDQAACGTRIGRGTSSQSQLCPFA